MRQYAWYSPGLDVIVLMTFMEECYISFEWNAQDLYDNEWLINEAIDPIYQTLWFPLGEL